MARWKRAAFGVSISAAWLFCYLLFSVVLSWVGGLAGFSDNVVVMIFVDIAFVVIGRIYYERLHRDMLRSENCTYSVWAAVGKCAILLMLWFCADILGNIIAYTVPDPALELYLAEQQVSETAFVVLSLLAAPLAEEVLFRGIIYTHLKSGFSVWASAIVSSLAFGFMHGTIAQFFIGTLFGIGQCFLFEYTRKLRWVIAMHVLVNMANVLIAGLSIPVELFTSLSVILFLGLIIVVSILVLYPESKRKLPSGC